MWNPVRLKHAKKKPKRWSEKLTTPLTRAKISSNLRAAITSPTFLAIKLWFTSSVWAKIWSKCNWIEFWDHQLNLMKSNRFKRPKFSTRIVSIQVCTSRIYWLLPKKSHLLANTSSRHNRKSSAQANQSTSKIHRRVAGRWLWLEWNILVVAEFRDKTGEVWVRFEFHFR